MKHNIGGNNEKTNLDVVTLICEQLDIIKPLENVSSSYKDKIVFVKDRPGHDLRYSIDNTKITTQLGWSPKVNFNDGIKTTIEWYLKNPEWCNNILNNNHIQRQGILSENKNMKVSFLQEEGEQTLSNNKVYL